MYEFPNFGNVAYGTVQLSLSEEDAIYEDLLYLNVPSTANPTGDIRGQLITIDYIEEGAFTAEILGQYVQPSAVSTENVGCGIVTYNCDTKVMEYLLMHSIEEPSGAIIGIGAANELGAVFETLETSISPIFGSVRLTNEQVHALYTEQFFFQVYTRSQAIVSFNY